MKIARQQVLGSLLLALFVLIFLLDPRAAISVPQMNGKSNFRCWSFSDRRLRANPP